MISVDRLSSSSCEQIAESDDESKQSSMTDSDMSGTSTERARKREMKKSNIFLMKVIQGQVSNELMGSRITDTDRENLSTFIPNFANQGNQSAIEQQVMTYQDVYEEAQKVGLKNTEITDAAARLNNMSTLVPKEPLPGSGPPTQRQGNIN